MCLEHQSSCVCQSFSVFFLPLLRMCLFCFCYAKLKLQAKEKITEAATEEARLFAPFEQVDCHVACFNAFKCWMHYTWQFCVVYSAYCGQPVQTVNQQNAQCSVLNIYVYYITTKRVPTCFSPQGIIISPLRTETGRNSECCSINI
jgi:hypothetical protein